MEKTTDGEKTFDTFWSSFYKATEDKLTALELEDLAVEGTVTVFHVADFWKLKICILLLLMPPWFSWLVVIVKMARFLLYSVL